MNTSAHRPGRFTVLRDTTNFLGGWALIAYQVREVPPGDMNEWLLLLAGTLIGAPGIAEIFAWRNRIGTATPESPSLPPDSLAPESSSPSTT